MIPIPYHYPSSGSDCEYAHPEWVTLFVNVSVVIIIVGLIGASISSIMMLIYEATDNEDAFNRISMPFFIISCIITLAGTVFVLIGITIEAVTGTKI